MADEGRIADAPGDVSHVCPGCRTGHPQGKDADPRHVIIGAERELQPATLADGSTVQVQVATDVAYHFDCHAAKGCDHCQDMLDAHDGSVKGKADSLTTPDHLVDIEPGEFEMGAAGVLVRRLTKSEAREVRETEHRQAGYEVVDADEALNLVRG